jgi:excinuclease ABC subunit C
MVTTAGRRAVRMIDNPPLLRERLRAAPASPGVYLMRDLDARVAYVGKAASLRSRLRSYFTGVGSHPDRTRRLVERVFDFEVIACRNEREALILENSLIKRYRPRFNIRLKDDKSYLYLKIPQPGALDAQAPGTAREGARKPRSERAAHASNYPRPYYTRRLARDGARYFGPYTTAASLRTTVRALRTIFPFRTCGDEVFARGRVCLDFHIKRCAGPCEGRIDEPAYARLLNEVSMFMDGRSHALTDGLRTQMAAASERLDFEAAARSRDRLRAIERINERQRMLQGARADEDCVAVALDGGRAMVAVLFARGGRMVGMETHELEGAAGLDASACLGAFVGQYYGSAPLIPRTVLLSDAIDDPATVQEFLAEQRGGRVELRVPQRGASRQLLDQARDTAATALRQIRVVEDFDAERTESLLADLQSQLDLPTLPVRIECYDISNTMGTNSVGSMVVFEDGRPRPAHYRHFGIKTVEGANDFASMQETLRRRFNRHRAAVEAATGADVPVDDPGGSNGGERRATGGHRGRGAAADESFGVLPDLIIIDGGRGQLSAARETLLEAGLDELPVFGLAKRNEELHRPGSDEPIVLARDSPTLFLVQRVRDEAHRFAITRHRARRGRVALKSKLDIVPGLGPVRRRALIKQFGGIDAIREASVAELTAVPGIPEAVALSIKELL